jgi:hypothetical protein
MAVAASTEVVFALITFAGVDGKTAKTLVASPDAVEIGGLTGAEVSATIAAR